MDLAGDAADPPVHALLHLRPALLERWLRSDAFRRRLTRLLRAARRRRELCLSLAAARAATRLAAGLDDPSLLKDANHRRACVELIQLARAGRRRAGSRAAGHEPAASPAREAAQAGDEDPPLAHPDLEAPDIHDLVRRLSR